MDGGRLSWGERYYLEDLPAVVAEVDPSRPYSAGSPWSGSWEHPPNDPDHQTFHSWDVWNRDDYVEYRSSAPRFVSEFGWQAPPAWRTLRDCVGDEPITPNSPGVLHHQKAEDGNGKLARGLVRHFPEPADVDAWHYLTQLNQVRAVETGVSHWRSHWPHTAGTVLWQLNDLWPVISWAAIDGAGRLKPLYHALHDLYAARALTIQPTSNGLDLCVLNDSPSAWTGTTSVYRAGDTGPVAAAQAISVAVGPRAVARVALPESITSFGDPAGEVLVAELDGRRALWYAAEPRECGFAGHHPDITVRRVRHGLEITVTATTLLRDFLVQPDRIHPAATADAGFLTLLPGESATVRVSCRESLDPSDTCRSLRPDLAGRGDGGRGRGALTAVVGRATDPVAASLQAHAVSKGISGSPVRPAESFKSTVPTCRSPKQDTDDLCPPGILGGIAATIARRVRSRYGRPTKPLE